MTHCPNPARDRYPGVASRSRAATLPFASFRTNSDGKQPTWVRSMSERGPPSQPIKLDPETESNPMACAVARNWSAPMSLAICANAVLQETRRSFASEPPHTPPPKLWIAMTSPGGVYAPRDGTYGESGVYLPDSSAAA